MNRSTSSHTLISSSSHNSPIHSCSFITPLLLFSRIRYMHSSIHSPIQSFIHPHFLFHKPSRIYHTLLRSLSSHTSHIPLIHPHSSSCPHSSHTHIHTHIHPSIHSFIHSHTLFSILHSITQSHTLIPTLPPPPSPRVRGPPPPPVWSVGDTVCTADTPPPPHTPGGMMKEWMMNG